MNFLTNKPFIFLWLFIPILWLIGFVDPESTVDINVHDTYFVIANQHILTIISVYFAGLGLAYWGLFKNKFKPVGWMTITHLICSIDTMIFYWLAVFFGWFSSSNDNILDDVSTLNMVISILVILFVLGQILFGINMILTLLFGRKSASVSAE